MKFNILILNLLLLPRFGNIIGISKKSEGICYDNRTSLLITTVCCRNYEFIDNNCKACGVGYYTMEAGREKCKPCLPNKYGKKCGRTCNCKENESCDNKNGSCIPWTTIKTLTEYWNYSRYQRQSTEESNKRIKVDANLKINKDTKNYAILIYMICAGFIILVLCAVAAFYKYQKNVKKVPKGTIKYGETDSDIQSTPSRSMQPNVLIELHDNESVYALIDDENLLNL